MRLFTGSNEHSFKHMIIEQNTQPFLKLPLVSNPHILSFVPRFCDTFCADWFHYRSSTWSDRNTNFSWGHHRQSRALSSPRLFWVILDFLLPARHYRESCGIHPKGISVGFLFVSKFANGSKWVILTRRFWLGIIEAGQMRPFSQTEFRQSLLRRTSGKRITAHDGSKFLNHHRTLSQRKPLLTGIITTYFSSSSNDCLTHGTICFHTASVESLPRLSERPGGIDKRQKR